MISCRDECGNQTEAETIEGSGWEYLQIQRRWRCSQCRRRLLAVNERKETL